MRNSPDTGIWSKGQNNENKNQYKNNDLRDRSTLVLELSKTHISIYFWVIYQRTTSTKILTIKYQTIVVSTELSHPSHETQATWVQDIFYSIWSIKCASTTYMNPSNGFIYGQPLEFRPHSYFVDFTSHALFYNMTSLPAFVKVGKLLAAIM